jgi:integrase
MLERKALVVDGFCKQNGTRTNYNKTGSADKPRFRVVLLPEFAILKLSDYITRSGLVSDDYCFTRNNLPIRSEYAEDVFVRAVKKAGITTENRKLVVHSLRYTYVTRMRRELPAEIVQKAVGHTDVAMTDYYTNNKLLDDSIAGLAGLDKAADNLFV